MQISNLAQEKGDEYEKLVARYYRDKGFIVLKNGRKGQTGDEGLDLIAFSQKETLFIQCKNQDSNNTKYYLKKNDIDTYIKRFDEWKKYRLTYPSGHIIRYVIAVSQKCIEKEAFDYAINHPKTPIEIIRLAIADNGESVYLPAKQKTTKVIKRITLSQWLEEKMKTMEIKDFDQWLEEIQKTNKLLPLSAEQYKQEFYRFCKNHLPDKDVELLFALINKPNSRLTKDHIKMIKQGLQYALEYNNALSDTAKNKIKECLLIDV